MTNEELHIEREERPIKGRYTIGLDGAEAEMTYSRTGETIGHVIRAKGGMF